MTAELISLIEDNPEDGDAYRTYGDWLEEQGEPRRNQLRGLHEIRDRITAGLTIDRAKLDHLEERITTFFETHRDFFWGALAKIMPPPSASRQRRDSASKIVWRHGFIYKAKLTRVARPTMDKVLDRLLTSDSGRFVVELDLGWPEDNAAIVGVLAARTPRALRRLHLTTNDVDLAPLWSALPRLHTLEIGPCASYGTIDLPALHTLHLDYAEANLGYALTQARLPALRTLVLDFHKNLADVLRAIVDTPLAHQLTELRVHDLEVAHNASFGRIAKLIED